jgi:hypothetical protein
MDIAATMPREHHRFFGCSRLFHLVFSMPFAALLQFARTLDFPAWNKSARRFFVQIPRTLKEVATARHHFHYHRFLSTFSYGKGRFSRSHVLTLLSNPQDATDSTF